MKSALLMRFRRLVKSDGWAAVKSPSQLIPVARVIEADCSNAVMSRRILLVLLDESMLMMSSLAMEDAVKCWICREFILI